MKKVFQNTFADYKKEASNWITLAGGEYYPDILKDACNLYKPVLVLFGQLIKSSESSYQCCRAVDESSAFKDFQTICLSSAIC